MSRLAALAALAIAALQASALASCSSGPKKNRVHGFASIVAEPMRIRRPSGPGADPEAGPGGEDYTARPSPDARYDCRPPETLYEPALVSEIRACVESVQAPLALGYKLVRDPIPKLVLFEPEEGSEQREALPECVKKSLLKLPVPREVFFFAEKDDEDQYGCYSTRLDVESDTPLGVRVPIDVWAMEVTIPLESPVADDATMVRILVAWSLSPVLKPGGPYEKIQGRAVPEAICAQCFDGATIPKRAHPYPPSWP